MEPLGHIIRKTMLYRTKVEYGDWAMNHVQGCSHGCRYPCFAFLMAKRFGRVSSYEEWLQPKIVDNTISLLEAELPRYAHEIKQVQLCFTTDPFMVGYPEVGEMSERAIELINRFHIPCVVLTKGVLPISLAKLFRDNMYGCTIITLDEDYRKAMEPGGAGINERIEALKRLHDAGSRTWVSMEPYPTPNLIEQDLGSVLDAVSFVDKIVFGRTHYDKRTSEYHEIQAFYQDAANQVRDFCSEHGIDCHIKRGTADE